MNRLSTATLHGVHNALVPDYDRGRPASIAHLGVGAFARAHLGVYVDDLIRVGRCGPIRGVSLRSNRAESQMSPQDCLYSVTTREPGRAPETRIIGSFATVETGPDAAVRAIADPAITMVTLTITEKAYEPDDDSSDTVHDRAAATSVPLLLAHGLLDRYHAGATPLVITSLDNVADNGAVLRDLVLHALEFLGGDEDGPDSDSGPEPGFEDWVRSEVAFPSSVVDRMVPATTTADMDEVAGRLGVRDDAAVIGEEHRSWVIESVAGLPPLQHAGVQVVNDIAPYQLRKLWLLNGPHSAVAYCGLLLGYDTIAGAVSDTSIRRFVGRLIEDVVEVAPPALANLEPAEFAAESVHRFTNDALGHRCTQVATDGSRKIPQRLLPVMALRRARGLGTERFATVIALWLAAVSDTPVGGITLGPISDPAVEIITEVLRSGGPAANSAPDRQAAGDALLAVFGADITEHVDAIVDAFVHLVAAGSAVLEVQ